MAAAGDQGETELDFGLIEQLLRASPLGGDQVSDTLPDVGANPLEAGASLLRLVDGLQLGTPAGRRRSTTPTGPTARRSTR